MLRTRLGAGSDETVCVRVRASCSFVLLVCVALSRAACWPGACYQVCVPAAGFGVAQGAVKRMPVCICPLIEPCCGLEW